MKFGHDPLDALGAGNSYQLRDVNANNPACGHTTFGTVSGRRLTELLNISYS